MHLVTLGRSPKTIKGYLQDLKQLQGWLEEEHNGPVYAKDLTSQDITDFLLYLKEGRDYKPSSRRRLAATIRGFLRWAYKQDHITTNLAEEVPNIKVPEAERKFLTPEEVQVWVDAVAHEVSKVAMWLMYYCGLRISEATNLKMDDVHLSDDGGWVDIRNAKGGKYRRVPVAPKLAAILQDYLTWRADSEYLLATEKTGRITTTTIQALLRDAKRKLGWAEDITPHTLRHSFASQIYKETQDILVVSRLLGHTNLATTQVYAHLHDDRMLHAVNVL